MNTNKKCPYCIQVIFNDTLHTLKFPINNSSIEIQDDAEQGRQQHSPDDSMMTSTTTKSTTKSTSFKELYTRQETIFNIIRKYIVDSNIMFFSESDSITSTMQIFCQENNIQFIDFSNNLTYKEKKKILLDIKNEDEDSNRRLYVINSYKDLIGFSFQNTIDHFISYSFLSKYCYKFICSRFYRVGRPTDKPFYFHTFFSY